MKRNHIWQSIELELRKAKNDRWPDHVVSQSAMVSNQSAKLMGLCYEKKYKKRLTEKTEAEAKKQIEEEAVKVAVTAIRFLENLK